MKMTVLGEIYDGPRDVIVRQDGAHVRLSVEAASGAREGVALLTPSQASRLAEHINVAAHEAETYSGDEIEE